MNYEIHTYLKEKSEFVPMCQASRPGDLDYIEGAIYWSIGSQTLMSQEHWDLIDQLWAYIVNGVRELMQSGAYETYFPDQPLRLAFRLANATSIEVEVGEMAAIVDREAFFHSLADGAERFFTAMISLVPEHQETWRAYLRHLEEIKSRLA